ncbi:MAG: biotin carboxylase N-terminal domain-containing protein, partial [Minisyncoccales bacterium]
MFKKILVANRGEIAIRIIRACKELGIKTVALCPEKGQEKNFWETELADEIGYLDEEGVYGYLNQRKILRIAKFFQVDAIHPGYGFLSENCYFAKLCQENNIKFIGPSWQLLKLFSDKIEAKRIARNCGLPVLPSAEREIMTEKDLKRIIKEIKLPIVLKAVDGGGGIGIEIINKENFHLLKEVFQKLKRVSQSAFASERIFIEKYLQSPRHIEFQVVGDGKNFLHLFERECSIQRRHQKLIEEAPSVFLEEKMRKKMGKLATSLIRSLRYEGLATVEFLVDRDKNFYFIEVNPRLQVEHPVTEAITNIDLVKEQILIASGERISFLKDDIKIQGHAIELRINAEDPLDNFKPSTG